MVVLVVPAGAQHEQAADDSAEPVQSAPAEGMLVEALMLELDQMGVGEPERQDGDYRDPSGTPGDRRPGRRDDGERAQEFAGESARPFPKVVFRQRAPAVLAAYRREQSVLCRVQTGDC